MKLTLQLKLLPTPDQHTALLETMHAFNAAASHAARVGFEAGVFTQLSIHRRCYRELRDRFGLSSQMAVRAIGKAVEVFKRNRTVCPVFRADGAMTYDYHLLAWKGPTCQPAHSHSKAWAYLGASTRLFGQDSTTELQQDWACDPG